MAKGLGAIGKGFSMGSMSKGLTPKAHGWYPRKESGAGIYGGTISPTIIEAYNSKSDYKRWRAGQDFYFGGGSSWADRSIYSLARFPQGAVDGRSKDIVTLFPSKDSPEKAWYVGMRTRGSIILPQPISAGTITINAVDPDPSTHTLVWDVTGILTTAQLGIFNIFKGDQFEDSAAGINYPDDLVEKDEGSIALVLTDVNMGSMTLTFDLSRPQGRIKKGDRIYWKKFNYDPTNPTQYAWSSTSARHLCSSFKFFCCCPDHLGGALANLEYPEGEAGMDEFPLPNAARTVRSAWESEGAGYYRQWRTLPFRCDERRDCKHIHSMRWACGCPWHEPDDYVIETDQELDMFGFIARETGLTDQEFDEYMVLRELNKDRYILSLAEVVGIELFPPSDVRDGIRTDTRPMLWNDREEPDPTWCRQNDWWCKRGTQDIKIFNTAAGKFESTITAGGIEYPMIEEVEEGAAGSPKIVP
jgi:hypothetical protein